MVNVPATYVRWNPLRCDRIIKHYGEDFFDGKTLLEVGTLNGQNGNTFTELGAIVTVQDAREEHVNDALKKYPHLTGYVHDLNKGLGTDDHFDIILHMGVLYHLESLQPLIDACSQCSHLILETRVCKNSARVCYYVSGNNNIDQSYTSKGIRPSPSLIESVLEEQGFTHERVKDLDSLGHFQYKWTWKELTKDILDEGHSPRAFWFCKRK